MLWSCLVFVGLSVASLCSRELLGLLVGGASAGDVSVFAGVVLTWNYKVKSLNKNTILYEKRRVSKDCSL